MIVGAVTGPLTAPHATVTITPVDPVVVAEVTADTALQQECFQRPLLFVRHSSDVEPDDVHARSRPQQRPGLPAREPTP